jgi:hypothetical protein
MKYTHKFQKNPENNKTKKMYAGDIEKHRIFRKILSIGYELETSTLSKFSLIGNSSDDEKILLNTSSNAKDYEVIKKIQNDKATEEENEKYENRLEELFEIDLYTTQSINKNKSNKLVKNENSTFVVANDVAVTPLTKYLNKLCNLNDDGKEDLIDKNELYTFDSYCDGKYKINFENWGKQDCGTFADVEWIVTYYKPKISNNIILETFINVAKNLILHLSSLKKTKGRLVMNFSESDTEVIKKPENRVFYNLPGTNMYYIQTQLLDEDIDTDDICVVPQMTFSCHIKDIVDIFKEIAIDSINIFENHTRLSRERVNLINKIEKYVNKLFESYNKSVPKDKRIRESKNVGLVKSMKNCIFMILFKLARYFNNYLQDDNVKNKSKNAKYLKDTLYFNSRHTNYELYKSLKKYISEYFSNSIVDKEIITIVQTLIVQQDILEEFLIEDKQYVRKNAFLITNNLEKDNKKYGNPYYSLISYFNFFEDPIDEISNDWLEYSGIDVYSSTSDIKNDVVLCEVRSFGRNMNTYIYSIADAELKNDMTKGICNRMTNAFKPDIPIISIKSLKKFISLHEEKMKKQESKRKENKQNIKN